MESYLPFKEYSRLIERILYVVMPLTTGKKTEISFAGEHFFCWRTRQIIFRRQTDSLAKKFTALVISRQSVTLVSKFETQDVRSDESIANERLGQQGQTRWKGGRHHR